QRNIVSAADMFEAIKEELPDTDILIKSAAVADYRPAVVAENKIKKGIDDENNPIVTDGSGMYIPLARTQDILGWVAENHHPGLFVCGFSMETENLLANSSKKLEKKKLNMIVANSLRTAGAGFGTDTNVVTLITKDGAQELPIMSKDDVAARILDRISEM
ncbi:MAG TPA: phosphopantothenoylcysteine decarboxylase, partial [Sarcina sp.]|nr:phosphopantothenoylcysteine decarboxylase [Sarcina sp.]